MSRRLSRFPVRLLVCVLIFASRAEAAPETVTVRGEPAVARGAIGTLGITVEKGAHLVVPLCPSQNIRYSVRIINTSTAGNGVASAQILDPIPDGASYVIGSVAGGASFEVAADRIVWNGNLAPGQSHEIAFSVTVDVGIPNGTQIVNRATGRLIIGEQVLQTTAELPVTVDCPPISIEINKSRQLTDPLCADGNIFYTVRVTNTSARNRTLTGRIEDPIPQHTSFAGSLSGGAIFDQANGRVVWEGNLQPGQSHSIGFSVTVDPGTPDGTVIANATAGLIRDPFVGDSAVTLTEVQDTVDCVQDVVAADPRVLLTLWLEYVEFIDDEDPGLFRNGGDMYFVSATRVEGTTREEASEWKPEGTGGQDNIDEGVEVLIGHKIFEQALCCDQRDLEVGLEFWDDDDETVAKILDAVAKLGELLEQPEIGIFVALARALGLAEIFPGNEELGVYLDRDLKTPWSTAIRPEPFPCPLSDSILDGEADELDRDQVDLDRPHDIVFRQGGDVNGRLWFRWKAPTTDGTCALLQAEPAAQQIVPSRLSDAPAAGLLASDLALGGFSATQLSGQELQLRWSLVSDTGQPVSLDEALDSLTPETSPLTFRAFLTTPRNAADAPTEPMAWRIDGELRRVDGSPAVVGRVAIWSAPLWFPLAIPPLVQSVGDSSVTLVFDHEHLGDLDRYSVSGELLAGATSLGRLPAAPTVEHLLDWIEDRFPPRVAAVRMSPLDVAQDAGGTPLPDGSIGEILVELTETVDLEPQDVTLTPHVPTQLTIERDRVRISPQQVLGAGEYTVTLAGTVTDTAGNPLDGNGDGIGGDAFEHRFRIVGSELMATDETGEPTHLFTTAEPIYAAGFGLPPSQSLDIYLIPRHLVTPGGPLEDRSAEGATPASANPSGTLAPTPLSHAPQPGEYSLIGDLDRDGRFDQGSDLLWRDPGIGVNVAEAVPSTSCTQDATTLCLNQGRFAVRMTWAAPQGTSGSGQAIPITEDTGYFWFFNPDNVEAVVKVLDACGPFDRFWVFAGGLTNVEVTLTVTDTVTGNFRTYPNPQGTPFQPIQDTDAFDTCAAGDRAVSEGPRASRTGAVPSAEQLRQQAWQEIGQALEDAKAATTAPLRLNDDRFELEVTWETTQGTSGVGHGLRLTDDTGYFWFFNPENVEMVVKVLDACVPFDRFWVFAGGLTNVAVRATVTDTETGAQFVFINPQQTPFQPIQATDAFDTCP